MPIILGCPRYLDSGAVCIYTYVCTVTPGLSNTGLYENLIYPTLHCESPSLLCVQFTLIYPTPGLSDTFYEKQTWSDKPGPTVYCTITQYRGTSNSGLSQIETQYSKPLYKGHNLKLCIPSLYFHYILNLSERTTS